MTLRVTPTALLVVHDFPPASGSGAQRALAVARYLPEYGLRPVVLTPRAEWARPRDDGLLAQVPPELVVVRTPSLEPRPRPAPPMAAAPARAATTAARQPSRLRRQLGHLRRFPDAHLGWLPFALAAALRTPYDVVYTSSGPFTSHLVGLVLRRLRRRPWVAELRDGWYQWNRAIFADYPAWRGALERRLEAAVVRGADRVVLVTERMAAAFRAQYPELPREHFRVVANGFDPRLLAAEPEPAAPGRGAAERFEVLHAGALYYGRSLAAFLHAAAGLVAAEPRFAAAFRLRLVGSLDSGAAAELAAAQRGPLGDHIQLCGQLAHAQSLQAMRSADLLLLVANTTPGAEATVPAKLFEYLAVGRPVLALAPPCSSTADVLASTRGGWLAAAESVQSITTALWQAFQAHQAGQSVGPDRHALAAYDRRLLTGQLARVFEDAAHRL